MPQTSSPPNEGRVRIRVSEGVKDRAAALSEHLGVTQTEIERMALSIGIAVLERETAKRELVSLTQVSGTSLPAPEINPFRHTGYGGHFQ